MSRNLLIWAKLRLQKKDKKFKHMGKSWNDHSCDQDSVCVIFSSVSCGFSLLLRLMLCLSSQSNWLSANSSLSKSFLKRSGFTAFSTAMCIYLWRLGFLSPAAACGRFVFAYFFSCRLSFFFLFPTMQVKVIMWRRSQICGQTIFLPFSKAEIFLHKEKSD